MSDLAAALREAGHEEIANALEQRELAGRLRRAGRDDLADALITGEHTLPAEQPEQTTGPPRRRLMKQLAEQLNAAQSKWLTLGGLGRSDDGQAA